MLRGCERRGQLAVIRGLEWLPAASALRRAAAVVIAPYQSTTLR